MKSLLQPEQVTVPRFIRFLSRFAIALILFLPAGCQQQEPGRSFNTNLYVFGTVLEISMHNISSQAGQEASAELNLMFQNMHHDLHAWERGSKLVALNQAFSEGSLYPYDQELVDLIKEASLYSELSGQHFNPAIGKLIRLWGFHTSNFPILAPPPADEDIKALVAQNPQMDDIVITNDGISSNNPAVALDFGGFAKGVAVDRAINVLRRLGIENAIVNAGGDLRAMGSHSERPWRIGIRHPVKNTPLATIETEGDEAIFTSGNYYRYVEHQGKRYAHIIDPATGYPVEHIASATVISRKGSLADAAATALVVAGPDKWREVASSMNLDAVLLVDEQGVLHMTPEMKRRLVIEDSKATFKIWPLKKG